MSEFASKWPDMKLWAITRANASLTPKVSGERDESLAEQVVISVIPAQFETAVSRFHMITAECWAPTKASGFALAVDAGFAIESAPRNSNPVVKAELNAGPNEGRDDMGNYFYSVTVLVTAHRLP